MKPSAKVKVVHWQPRQQLTGLREVIDWQALQQRGWDPIEEVFVADPDGYTYYVVSATNPGVANWLDSNGVSSGEIFARFDHSGAARRVGLSMPDTQVVVFGNPKSGTPLMLASPLVALDLPLRVLVVVDGGQAVVSYIAPSYLAERYGILPDLVKNIAGVEKIVDEVVA